MAVLTWDPKDPDETLDYTVDWEDFVTDENDNVDAIAAVTWTISPSGSLSQPVSPVAAFTDTEATIWLTGGTAGQKYTVACKITTDAGRVAERTVSLRVKTL